MYSVEQIFQCLKWPNIEQIIQQSGHTADNTYLEHNYFLPTQREQKRTELSTVSQLLKQNFCCDNHHHQCARNDDNDRRWPPFRHPQPLLQRDVSNKVRKSQTKTLGRRRVSEEPSDWLIFPAPASPTRAPPAKKFPRKNI